MTDEGRASRRGLIPAHAGKTRRRFRRSYVMGAHPRSRGENSLVVWRDADVAGSSPLTRGKRDSGHDHPHGDRLIPAHAGKTVRARTSPAPKRAHPRSRGENWRTVALTAWSLGSSPLTRGKPDRRHCQVPACGLIPAHAGKTRARSSSLSSARAHPRSRGENVAEQAAKSASTGSSPLTRGKHNQMTPGNPDDGLIPAHAGKTREGHAVRRDWPAHPRSRGENRRSARSRYSLTGLIPAHAGKTLGNRSRIGCLWAHPRSRGENRALPG